MGHGRKGVELPTNTVVILSSGGSVVVVVVVVVAAVQREILPPTVFRTISQTFIS